MEIERKFIPVHIPYDLSRCECHTIEQGYISTDPVIRIRRKDDQYILTCKSSGLMAHEEFELDISYDSYLHLQKKCDGRFIKKKRYIIPVDNYPSLVGELDIFEGYLKGLTILEVEFKSTDEALSFVPPAWFGKDVTNDPQYHNANMIRG